MLFFSETMKAIQTETTLKMVWLSNFVHNLKRFGKTSWQMTGCYFWRISMTTLKILQNILELDNQCCG